ncbi:MAG: LPS export ABC transporter periplasmic protein LptC [Bryobacterales bacterium]|nr:LPS export ABC transporter periplasmic protein LptC [Bryobacterales bacterium]
MRRFRHLFLLALVVALAAVVAAYRAQRGVQAERQPVLPKALPQDVQASSRDWVYFKDNGGVPVVEVRARDMARIEKPEPRIQLTGVQLKLFHKDGKQYDLVKSAAAIFDEAGSSLFSEGDVEITLAIPADQPADQPTGRLLTIKTSGVDFDASTGRAHTERPVQFAFDSGDGTATGATYEPAERQLHLHNEAHLVWRGRGPAERAMVIEAGQLIYRESEARVLLTPWSRFTRQSLKMEGAESTVYLDKGHIQRVESVKARGVDAQPNRELDFSADLLHLFFNADSHVEKITGETNAVLNAKTATANTRVTTDRLDLEFNAAGKESLLQTATAHGSSMLESKPTVRPGGVQPPTRLLKSDVIVARMRDGGQELAQVETHTPGTVDFLPNAPAQPRRHLEANRLWMTYGPRNMLEAFRAVQVSTRTDKPPTRRTPKPPPAITFSDDLTASFHPATGDLTKLEQWNNFRYQEGERQATATKATLEQATDRILLESDGKSQAKTWDPTGSLTANTITLDQATGRTFAEGNVLSTRLPDSKPAKNNSAMLSPGEPLYARAQRMTAVDNNRDLTYEGAATLWQAANRLQADRVRILREKQTLDAEGNVVSQLIDSSPDQKTAAPVTIVRAQSLHYDDAQNLAHYKGNVRLNQGGGMDVQSAELRAFLVDEPKPGQSRLQKAFADGSVIILQQAAYKPPGGGPSVIRTRRGTAEHAEYYLADGRVILRGGNPQMADSVKGTTRGRQLTWFSANDSLLVEGAETQPVKSRILRR